MLYIMTSEKNDPIQWYIGEATFGANSSLVHNIKSIAADGDELLHIVKTCPIQLIAFGPVLHLYGDIAKTAVAHL